MQSDKSYASFLIFNILRGKNEQLQRLICTEAEEGHRKKRKEIGKKESKSRKKKEIGKKEFKSRKKKKKSERKKVNR